MQRTNRALTGFAAGAALLICALVATPAMAIINGLELRIVTGEDDLRGGRDNVNAIVILRDGRHLRFDNINRGMSWPSRSERTVVLRFALRLGTEIATPDAIVGVNLVTTFRGGFDGDNWDLAGLRVTPIDSELGRLPPLLDTRRRHRFTGDNVPFAARWRGGGPGEVSHIIVVIRTGDDDLRGGNDNVNVRILYRGGEQYVRNINQGARWPDGSTRRVRIPLDRPVRVGEVIGVILETDSSGGIAGDNWNVDRLTVTPALLLSRAYPDCFSAEGRPLVRFTGQNRSYRVSCR